MKQEKNIPNPNTHVGKHTGYDLINGEYHIAPIYRERFDEIFATEAGIEKMLSMVVDHVSQDLKHLALKRQALWLEVADDLGIDLKAHPHWRHVNGVLSPIEENANKGTDVKDREIKKDILELLDTLITSVDIDMRDEAYRKLHKIEEKLKEEGGKDGDR